MPYLQVKAHLCPPVIINFLFEIKSEEKESHKYRVIMRNVNSSSETKVVFGLRNGKPLSCTLIQWLDS